MIIGGGLVNYGVFLPWKKERKLQKQRKKYLYFIPEKEPHIFSINGIHHVKKPFVSMPNPQGTLEFFMEALNKNAHEEAKGYICKELMEYVDMDELHQLFDGKEPYQYFLAKPNENLNSVTIAMKEKSGQTKMIAVHMIEEPNVFGKWKICSVEKES